MPDSVPQRSSWVADRYDEVPTLHMMDWLGSSRHPGVGTSSCGTCSRSPRLSTAVAAVRRPVGSSMRPATTGRGTCRSSARSSAPAIASGPPNGRSVRALAGTARDATRMVLRGRALERRVEIRRVAAFGHEIEAVVDTLGSSAISTGRPARIAQPSPPASVREPGRLSDPRSRRGPGVRPLEHPPPGRSASAGSSSASWMTGRPPCGTRRSPCSSRRCASKARMWHSVAGVRRGRPRPIGRTGSSRRIAWGSASAIPRGSSLAGGRSTSRSWRPTILISHKREFLARRLRDVGLLALLEPGATALPGRALLPSDRIGRGRSLLRPDLLGHAGRPRRAGPLPPRPLPDGRPGRPPGAGRGRVPPGSSRRH